MNDCEMQKVLLKCAKGIVAVGNGCSTKVNALIGISRFSDYQEELVKLEALNRMKDGPDIVADLSTICGSLDKPIWQRIVEETEFVAATVPVYAAKSKEGRIDANQLLDIAINQMENGVGLLTIHLTPDRDLIKLASKRLTPCTSRGGKIVIRDILAHPRSYQNVYYEIIEKLLHVAKHTGTVFSLGTTFRPANIFDSLDDAQIREIKLQKKLAEYIRGSGVGVIVEGPGHCRPIDIKRAACFLRKTRSPVMALGPIPLDSAIGMDHLAGTIGATLLGFERCAHILAGITREEHTGNIPSMNSIIEAVTSSRIAGRIIDIHLLGKDDREYEIATVRANSKSCVFQKSTPACSRCAEKCPLIDKI